MSSKKNKNLIYTIVFIVIAIIVVSYYFSVSNNQTDKNQTNKLTQQSNPDEHNNNTLDSDDKKTSNNNLAYYGKIYFIKKTDGIYQIYSKENDNPEQLLYTDHDEDEKVKFAKSMTNSQKFLALIAPADLAYGGSLYLISADGSGNKEKIVDQFVSPQPPIISPDEEKIAYVLFSNAEMEYGFSLYIMDLNEENKVKIDSDPTMLSNPAFDQNAKNIAYLKNTEIITSDIDGKQKDVIYTLDKNESLNTINWNIGDKILIAIKNNNQNKTTLIAIDNKNKSTQAIYESEGNLTDPIWIDTELNLIAFINSDNNQLEIVDLNQNSKNISQATGIIKWLK